MRTTRSSLVLAAAAFCGLPSLAAANCYSIYDAQNRLAFQSTIAPIDLSARISDAMRARFPGSFLVILPDDSSCLEFRSGPTVSPRFDSGTGSGVSSRGDASIEPPLLRGARAPIDSAIDATSPSREAERRGNTLNVRRAAP